MKNVFQKVLQHEVISQKPPVLIDVGASGALPRQWRWIAPFSICVAFDADTRDFSVDESTDKGYRKLYSLNRLVGATSSNEVDFYLTRSPYCSSSLYPDNSALEPWAFHKLFDLEKTVKMPAVDLSSALEGCGVDYVDWYKTDSQGTDLRIFDALPQTVITHAIVAEFEPGIIDAYIGEDKLHQVMSYMEKQPFWVSNMVIKGSQRIDQCDLSSLNILQRKFPDLFLKTAPGWCEIAYVNKFDVSDMGLREYLLGWVFSSIKGEHGFALHLAKNAAQKFYDPLLDELIVTSKSALSGGYLILLRKLMENTVRIIFRGEK
jgi:hypothetical protein